MTEEAQTSIPYLVEAGKPIEPSVALGWLTRMEAISEKGVNEEMLRQTRVRLERSMAIPEAILCVACAEKPRC